MIASSSSWRYEAAWVLVLVAEFRPRGLWAFHPACATCRCSPETVHYAADLTMNGMRSTKEVLDEADLIYRCHWAVRQATSGTGDPFPEALTPA